MADAFPSVQSKSNMDNIQDKAVDKVEAEEEQDPLATGLADWDLLPPQVVIRRARKKKDVL